MKRNFILVILLIMAIFSVQAAELVNEEVLKAFLLTFGAYFDAAMSYSFSQVFPAGVTGTADGSQLSFTDYDMAKFEEEYTKMSGTITMDPLKGLKADLTLKGGSIKSLSYFVPMDQLGALNAQQQEVILEITANGQKYSITMPPAVPQG